MDRSSTSEMVNGDRAILGRRMQAFNPLNCSACTDPNSLLRNIQLLLQTLLRAAASHITAKRKKPLLASVMKTMSIEGHSIPLKSAVRTKDEIVFCRITKSAQPG